MTFDARVWFRIVTSTRIGTRRAARDSGSAAPQLGVTVERLATSLAAIVVGAGPAGLATAAGLKRRGIDATILEAGSSVGTSWRSHYRRLRLHTVKEHSSLPGLPFADDIPRYPSRTDLIGYLEAYAAHFGIALRTDERVRRIAVID